MTIIGKTNVIISAAIGRGDHPSTIAEKLQEAGVLNTYWQQQPIDRILGEQ